MSEILRGDFNWKIWFKKWGFGLGATFVGAGAIYTASFIGANPFPPEYAFWSGLLVTVLIQIGNAIKHA